MARPRPTPCYFFAPRSFCNNAVLKNVIYETRTLPVCMVHWSLSTVVFLPGSFDQRRMLAHCASPYLKRSGSVLMRHISTTIASISLILLLSACESGTVTVITGGSSTEATVTATLSSGATVTPTAATTAVSTSTTGPTPTLIPTATATPHPTATPTATPLPYGAFTCQQGYVWRQAFDDGSGNLADYVCVTPSVRAQAAADNAAASSRWTNGAYGVVTCINGYVWREAVRGDFVCVLPADRQQAVNDNAAATSRFVQAPKACLTGYVWREAYPTDYICVLPASRTQAANDNTAANSRFAFSGPYGPTTCINGYVWRQALVFDHVCVTPTIRTQTAQENAAAPSHTQP